MSFGTSTPTTKPPTLGFAPLGTSASSSMPSFNFSGGGTKPSFSFGSTPASGTTGFSLGGAPAAQTTATQATSTVPTATALTTPATSAAPATQDAAKPGFSLNFSMPAATSSAATTGSSLLPSTTIATSTTTAPSSTPASINFVQLEESINKWTLDLEEQEKTFMNQAAQINTWDHFLIKNADKIVSLNNEVENVKLEQKKLDHELDFILAQQKELEDCLVPLEKELASNNAARDPQRENMYQSAENIDVQLKQMSEDLKEIIEHLNDSNRSQDNSDPIVQIGRILNFHMNSLQWIDQSTLQIQNQLDEITKLHGVYQKDSDRMF